MKSCPHKQSISSFLFAFASEPTQSRRTQSRPTFRHYANQRILCGTRSLLFGHRCHYTACPTWRPFISLCGCHDLRVNTACRRQAAVKALTAHKTLIRPCGACGRRADSSQSTRHIWSHEFLVVGYCTCKNMFEGNFFKQRIIKFNFSESRRPKNY